MRAVDLITKKRDGKSFSEEEIRFLINGYVDGTIPDYQISSLAMAIYFKGLSFFETGYLTRAMIDSGDIIDLSGVKGALVDKHSTGGVGDKVSLILAPLAAACGLVVPMMSGRSLGHTGGTLDKLESIPGYRTDLSVDEFIRIIKECGYAMTGQSESVVPADRKLYALRDVTATVESIPMITASIMSKKFAEGAESFVFDVKYGSGAFMKNLKDAETLAVSLINTGKSLGRRVNALITDMDQPLGRMVGNFLEIREVIDSLHNRGPEDLIDLTIRLTTRMLVLGGIVQTVKQGEKLCRLKIKDGSAWKKFLHNVTLQGGDIEKVIDPGKGLKAEYIEPVISAEQGFVQRIDAYKVGTAAGLLGASRSQKETSVLPEVGIEILKIQGEPVQKGEKICFIHAGEQDKIPGVIDLVRSAYTLSGEQTKMSSRVMKELI